MVNWETVLVSVGASVVGSILVSIVSFEYSWRRKQSLEESDELLSWYNRSAEFATQVRREWRKNFIEPDRHDVRISDLQNELDVIEGQISRHATEGEQLGADEEVIDGLDQLASECKKTSEIRGGTQIIERLEERKPANLEAVENVQDAIEERQDGNSGPISRLVFPKRL